MNRNEIDAVCAQIKVYHRRRRYAMKVQQKVDRALESYIRINYTKWSPDLADKEREAENKKALEILKRAREGDSDDDALVSLVQLTDRAREPFDSLRKENEKLMEGLAKQLPVYRWLKGSDDDNDEGNGIRGAGAPGLATIVAEAGPLHNYANPQKLFKRLGYAPYDGHAGSTWKRESWRPRTLTAEEWTENPFSGERYALMTQVVTWLVNAQWIGVKRLAKELGVDAAEIDDGKPNGPYGEIYAARRKRTMQTHPDWTRGHRRNDALRIVMKEFLLQLWCAWNGRKRVRADQGDFDIRSTNVGSAAAQDVVDNQRQAGRRKKSKKQAQASHQPITN